MLIDIYFLRQTYGDVELEQLGSIHSSTYLADALTKGKGDSFLLKVLRAHKVSIKVEQRINE